MGTFTIVKSLLSSLILHHLMLGSENKNTITHWQITLFEKKTNTSSQYATQYSNKTTIHTYIYPENPNSMYI
jgi:hypothetical protein